MSPFCIMLGLKQRIELIHFLTTLDLRIEALAALCRSPHCAKAGNLADSAN